MPCPYFEPLTIASEPQHPGARLPLVDEYDGRCRAQAEPFQVPEDLRFRCCNHGYARGVCPHFPLHDKRSAIRFDVSSSTPSALELLCVEETAHTPTHWHTVTFYAASREIIPVDLNPCERAQIVAFSSSFLSRFPVPPIPAPP